MSALPSPISNYSPCSKYPSCELCQDTTLFRGEAIRWQLEMTNVHRGPDMKDSRSVPEVENAEPVERMAAHHTQTMPGLAERHGEMDSTHIILAHWRTSRRPLVEAVPASPEALSTVPAEQHPEQRQQFTWTPVLTTVLSSEQLPARHNGDAALECAEQEAASGDQASIATGQERAPARTVYSEDGYLQVQTVTGEAPETLDAIDLLKAKIHDFLEAVSAYGYDPLISPHRTATAHVPASRSTTSPELNGTRSLDPTEQAASEKSKNHTEMKIPRPIGCRGKTRKVGMNIQEAMGLDADAASRKIYKRIVYSARELSMEAQIDFSETFSMQEADRVAEFCRIARHIVEVRERLGYEGHTSATYKLAAL
ncbi:hypothetical protein FA95DRAFT_128849 [Auriscalpium vulgare]|uniref:Uncharacterized protein n=1 Tax=Auriscalpium vulgare TaxID=40419 RepID=A0ACB8RNR2_9AGAM|nr:hypothetical protein FA95DRAFT_128849 [Auriscalpium vulgare]